MNTNNLTWEEFCNYERPKKGVGNICWYCKHLCNDKKARKARMENSCEDWELSQDCENLLSIRKPACIDGMRNKLEEKDVELICKEIAKLKQNGVKHIDTVVCVNLENKVKGLTSNKVKAIRNKKTWQDISDKFFKED